MLKSDNVEEGRDACENLCACARDQLMNNSNKFNQPMHRGRETRQSGESCA